MKLNLVGLENELGDGLQLAFWLSRAHSSTLRSLLENTL